MKAPAVVYTGPGQVEMRKVEIPEPREDELLIRTEYSLVSSGTERWIWRGEFHRPDDSPLPVPLVPGYQRVGIVEEVGSEVKDLQPGMRVTATISRLEEVTAFSGSHCQYGVTHFSQCLAVEPGVSPVSVSGLVLTQVGYNGGSRPVVHEGDVAVVLGDGLVGQWLAQRLSMRGAKVFVAGRHDLRLDRAEAYAQAYGINVRGEDLMEVMRRIRPYGVDIVADTLAVPDSIDLALGLLRHDGQLVLNGYYREGYHLLSIQDLHEKEISVYNPSGWTRERMEATLKLVKGGQMEVEGLVTHRVAWPHAAEAYKRLVWNKEEDFLGIVIDWQV